MNNSIKVLFSFFFFLFFNLLAVSQEERTSLQKAIASLEQEYSTQFSFSNRYVNVDQDVLLLFSKDLKKQLDYLERQTSLKFEQLSTSNVIIRPFQNKDLISICGYAKNTGFKEENITIVIKGKKSQKPDNNGRFELDNISFYDILLFYREDLLVKQILAKNLFKINCLSVELGNKEFKLDEVIIQNYLADGVEKKNQKIIISQKKFKVLAGLTEPDLLRTLQQIPNVSSPYETASQIYVRGGTPDQNLVLWNGIKTYNQGHFFGLLSAFNPYAIDSLNFYNKGIPSNYSGRLASVIEMKSSSLINDTFSGNMGTNLLYSDAVLKIPLINKKLSTTISVRRSFTDLWKSPTYTSFSDRVFQNTKINNSKNGEDNLAFSDYSFSLNAKPSQKDEIQFHSLFAKNDLKFVSQNNTQQFFDELETINNGYGLQWNHKFYKYLTLKTNIGVANYLLDYKFKTLQKNTQIQKTSIKKNFIQDFNSYLQLDYQLNNTQHFNVGIALERNNIRYEFKDIESNFSLLLDQNKNLLNTKGAYVSYQVQKPKNYTLQLGLRTNKYSTDKQFYFEPRLYFKVHLNNSLSINTTFNSLSQAVTQINESVASSLSLENVLWRVTNDDGLKTLTSNQISLGSTFKKKSWFIEFDTFYKKTKNITTITSGFISELNSIFNIGEQQVKGADLFIKKQIGNYSSWLSLAYLNQKTRFNGFNNNKFFTSNLNIDFNVNWSHFYEYKKFNFALSWLWHSGKSITKSNAISAEGTPLVLKFDTLNNGTLPIYHKLDVSALYNFKTNPNSKLNYKLGVSIQNIYNRKSIINREFRLSPGLNNSLLTLDYSSLGITPNLSFRVLW